MAAYQTAPYIVGATIGRPHKTNGENQTKRRRTEEIKNAVGAGALDSPLYINVFLGSSKASTPTEV